MCVCTYVHKHTKTLPLFFLLNLRTLGYFCGVGRLLFCGPKPFNSRIKTLGEKIHVNSRAPNYDPKPLNGCVARIILQSQCVHCVLLLRECECTSHWQILWGHLYTTIWKYVHVGSCDKIWTWLFQAVNLDVRQILWLFTVNQVGRPKLSLKANLHRRCKGQLGSFAVYQISDPSGQPKTLRLELTFQCLDKHKRMSYSYFV